MTASILVVDDSKSSRKLNLALVHELLGDQVRYLDASGGEAAMAILRASRSIWCCWT
ncbi:MAG: hypothetical protein IPH37_10340 [Burkholderiales bacterium]|nr:hypothetical protein [Burkholderiales bacterium]